MSTDGQAPKSGSLIGKLAAARAASVEATGLVKPGASTETAHPETPKSTLSTGMANTASMAAKTIGVQKLPSIDAVRPKRTSPKQVLFRAQKPNLGFHMANVRIGFIHGWLMTEDPKLIEYLRNEKNATHFGVVEVKEEETNK